MTSIPATTPRPIHPIGAAPTTGPLAEQLEADRLGPDGKYTETDRIREAVLGEVLGDGPGGAMGWFRLTPSERASQQREMQHFVAAATHYGRSAEVVERAFAFVDAHRGANGIEAVRSVLPDLEGTRG